MTLQQIRSNPYTLSLVHKVTFFATVLLCSAVQAIATRYPERMNATYLSVIVILLLPVRYVVYRSRKWHYFMLDFCYFTNYALVLAIATRSSLLWRCVFVWANGPVAAAIVGWRNSLVFHSLDKVTTFAIHSLPMLVTLADRWLHSGGVLASGKDSDDDAAYFLPALAGYVLWQVLYWIKTEIVDRDMLDGDPAMLTSLRWIVSNKKGCMHRVASRLAKATGALREGDAVNSKSLRIKLIFVTCQLLYTVVCMALPVLVLRRSFACHLVFFVLMMSAAVWNGATFYFSVFCVSYDRERKEGRQTLYALAKPPKGDGGGGGGAATAAKGKGEEEEEEATTKKKTKRG